MTMTKHHFQPPAANGFERSVLWRRWHKRIPWDDATEGYWEEIGRISDLPVGINVSFAKVGGCWVAFYACQSMVSHYDWVEDWILRACGDPQSDGRRAQTDAMNFHHVVHHAQRKRLHCTRDSFIKLSRGEDKFRSDAVELAWPSLARWAQGVAAFVGDEKVKARDAFNDALSWTKR